MKSCFLFLSLDTVYRLMFLQNNNCISPPVQTILHLATTLTELYDLERLLMLFSGWNRVQVLSYRVTGAELPGAI